MTEGEAGERAGLRMHGDDASSEGVRVFVDTYACPECGVEVEITDWNHRTHRGYRTPSIQCVECGEGMERIA